MFVKSRTLGLGFSSMHVFLLSSPGILEPNLGHPFTKSCDLGYPFQVLTVRVGVQLEIGLKDLELLFCECRSDPFRFIFVVAFSVAAIWFSQKHYFL